MSTLVVKWSDRINQDVQVLPDLAPDVVRVPFTADSKGVLHYLLKGQDRSVALGLCQPPGPWSSERVERLAHHVCVHSRNQTPSNAWEHLSDRSHRNVRKGETSRCVSGVTDRALPTTGLQRIGTSPFYAK